MPALTWLLPTDDAPPLHPGTDQAREWLARELAKAEYVDRPSLADRFFRWLRDLLGGVDVSGGQSGLSGLRWLFVLALLVVGGALLYAVLRPVTRSARRPGAKGRRGVLDEGDTRSAAELRRAARAALAAGHWDLAVLEGYRAMAQGAVERTILEDIPGRTADELAVGLAAAFPTESDALHRAAGSFDAVRYGDVRAGEADAQQVVALDGRVAAARPDLAAVGYPR